MKHAKGICFAALLFLFLLVACGETSISSEHNDGDEDVLENMEEGDGDTEDVESVENEEDGDVTEEDGDIIPDGDEEGLESDSEDLETDGDALETDDGCEPDSTWCEENTLHVCDDTGREYVPEDCETYTCIEPESAESFCRPEHALSFDGETGYVQLSDDFLARKQVHSTVEAWVYWQGAGEGAGHIYSEGSVAELVLKFGPIDNQYLQFAVHCSDDSWSIANWDSILLEGWHHISGVNTPNKRMLFVDGELVAEADGECLSNATDPEPSYLGASGQPGGEIYAHFNGIIDEVRVSNAVRYDETFTPEVRFEPDEATVALWHLDEGNGDTATDEVSGLVAPLVGGVDWAAGKTDH